MKSRIKGFQPTRSTRSTEWHRVDGDQWELGLAREIPVRIYRAQDGAVVDDGLVSWNEAEWRGDWAVYI